MTVGTFFVSPGRMATDEYLYPANFPAGTDHLTEEAVATRELKRAGTVGSLALNMVEDRRIEILDVEDCRLDVRLWWVLPVV